MDNMKFSFLVLFVALLGCKFAQAQERKPYVNAPWLSISENRGYSHFSTCGTWVYINMAGLSFAEGDWGALEAFAKGIKRYSQATRFLASWETTLPESHYFDRWVYDRNQEVVFHQSSDNGSEGWNGFCVTEPVGVTDATIIRAARDENNTVYDLLRFGATNRNLWYKKRWVLILKSDPRVMARRTGFLNKEEEKKPNS